ncbi:MAG TPA: AbrB/MazE/SpoVT family DNA-binding domain-containing protein [Firmicutes bacterium]|jgi:antitoxin MazE|nr:AbrB/MazE/SpoVT family DNA-binding domain-containing protein [Bacillota bacterium]
MLAKVQKWGNSLAIRIPRGLAEQLKVQQNSEVDLSLDGDRLVIRPRRSEPSLAALLAQVTDENTHAEVAAGEPIGREVW